RRRHAQGHRATVRRHLRPPPARERRSQVIVTCRDPHSDSAVDELDHSRIEPARRRRTVHSYDPTPVTADCRLQELPRPWKLAECVLILDWSEMQPLANGEFW